MKELKCLIESMEMEMEAAECYYHKALGFKEKYPQIAQTYIDIASQELMHCDKFHTSATTLISKYKSTQDTEVPKEMQIIWDYEHKKLMEEYDEIKYKLSKFTV